MEISGKVAVVTGGASGLNYTKNWYQTWKRLQRLL